MSGLSEFPEWQECGKVRACVRGSMPHFGPPTSLSHVLVMNVRGFDQGRSRNAHYLGATETMNTDIPQFPGISK